MIYFVTHVFITLARHPDPERSEGEGPHALRTQIMSSLVARLPMTEVMGCGSSG